MDGILTGEWVDVPGRGVDSIQVVVCSDENLVLTANGKIFLISDVKKAKMRRMDRFVISQKAMEFLIFNKRWKISFENAKPGMKLLVPVPPFGPDLLNYVAVGLTTLAVKDTGRQILIDQDGNLMNLSVAFYFGEEVISDHGFLSEKGQMVVNQMYS